VKSVVRNAGRLPFVVVVAIVLLTGVSCCGQAGPVPTSIPAATPSATLRRTPIEVSLAHQAAIQALGDSLGIPVNRIQLIRAEAMDWPDGCLGARRVGVMCSQIVTPGFRIILETGGTQYEYRTNADGSIVAPGAGGPVTPMETQQMGVTDELAKVLDVPSSEVRVLSSVLAEWPDACLGISLPGVACAEAVTAGYIFTLEAQGTQYEYHTNQDGSVIQPATLGMTWHREGGIAGFCDDMTILLPDRIYAASCKGNLIEINIFFIASEEELAQFRRWQADYGAVTVTQQDKATTDAMTITLALFGRGASQPAEVEQQAMLAWAQDIYTRIISR
jgi:hypothetical protein